VVGALRAVLEASINCPVPEGGFFELDERVLPGPARCLGVCSNPGLGNLTR
jgi:hypothetical protein